jgi:hypothetical protein
VGIKILSRGNSIEIDDSVGDLSLDICGKIILFFWKRLMVLPKFLRRKKIILGR